MGRAAVAADERPQPGRQDDRPTDQLPGRRISTDRSAASLLTVPWDAQLLTLGRQ